MIKYILWVILCFPNVSMGAWWINNSLPAITNLGTLLSTATLDSGDYAYLSNNTAHQFLFYTTDTQNTNFQILDVNLTAGTFILTNGASLGRMGVRQMVAYTNGLIYLASGEASGNGYFSSYNPANGVTAQISQTTGSDPGQYDEIGDDGWIYIGGFPKAFVDRYFPPTSTYQKLGSMDTIQDYAYTLGADTRYLYIGVGENPWSLAVWDSIGLSTNHYFVGNDTYGAVRHATNGLWYYQRSGPATGNVMTWYSLSNGVAGLLGTTPPSDLLVENAQRGHTVDGAANSYLVGYSNNLDFAYPDSVSNYATIQYKLVGAGSFSSIVASNFTLGPISISRLYPVSSTNLLGFSSFYGPVYTFNTVTLKTTRLGIPQYNLYDAAFLNSTDYFCGYVAAQLRYAPTLPWTLVASTPNFFSTSVNPYQTPLQIGKHEYFSTVGSDNLIYVAAEHARDSTGGELGWYNPNTGTSSSDRLDFQNDEPADLKPAIAGTKLVYSGIYSNLFVFDVPTKTLTRTIRPMGIGTVDKVVEVSSGIMFGAAGSNVYKVNISTGALIVSNQMIGRAFQESMTTPNERLTLGPDGYIWLFRWYRDGGFFNQSSLYRINPSDMSFTTPYTNTFYTYGENNIMFNGGDAYLYGTTTLFKIPNLLTNDTPTMTNSVAKITNFHVKKTKVGP